MYIICVVRMSVVRFRQVIRKCSPYHHNPDGFSKHPGIYTTRTGKNVASMRNSRIYPVYKNMWYVYYKDAALRKECTKLDYFNSRIMGLDTVRGMNTSVNLFSSVIGWSTECLTQ